MANSRLQTPAETVHPTQTVTPALTIHPTPTVTPAAVMSETEHPDVTRRITGQTGLLDGVAKFDNAVPIMQAVDLTAQYVQFTNSLQEFQMNLNLMERDANYSDQS